MPVPLTTCALLVERRGTAAQRRLLPTDEVAIHGARWLAVRDEGDEWLRGWAQVEKACADVVAPACLQAIEGEGLPATRIEMSAVLDVLRTARGGPK